MRKVLVKLLKSRFSSKSKLDTKSKEVIESDSYSEALIIVKREEKRLQEQEKKLDDSLKNILKDLPILW